MGQQVSKTKQNKIEDLDFENLLQQEKKILTTSEKLQNAYRNSYNARVQDKQTKKDQPKSLIQPEQFVLKQLSNMVLQKKPSIQLGSRRNSQFNLQGILQKSSENIFSFWKERYCMLKDNHFSYHENKDPTSPREGYINFNLLSCTLTQNSKKQFIIHVDNGTKKFMFRSNDEKVAQKWVHSLRQTIQLSYGKKYKLTYLSHYHRFWRKQYFSEQQFRQNAQIGDILLFRGTKKTSVLQRAITFEQYDHIGVLLKNIRDQIILFEANGASGVGICSWRNFIKKKWYKDQDLVVFRKLHINRTPQFYNCIEQFVAKNVGKKYKFSIKNLLINRNSNNEEQKIQFFCSSLVASLYKFLGLLNQNVSATKYMPYTFSQKQNLQLQQSKFGKAYLGRQKIIVFQQNFFEKN